MEWDFSRFANRLNKLLNDQKLSQVDLARRSGISQTDGSAIGHFLAGRQQPRLWHIESMASALGVTPGFLGFGSEEVTMSGEETDIVKTLRKMPAAQRTALMSFVELTTEPVIVEKKRPQEDLIKTFNVLVNIMAITPVSNPAYQIANEEMLRIQKQLRPVKVPETVGSVAE